MSEKKRYLKLHENLGDGQHETLIAADDDGYRTLAESMEAWAEEALPGESVSVEIVEMTEAEHDALPEV